MKLADIAMMIILGLAANVATILVFGDVAAGYLGAMLVVILYIAYWLRGIEHWLYRIVRLLSAQEEARPSLKAIIAQLRAVLRDIAAEEMMGENET